MRPVAVVVEAEQLQPSLGIGRQSQFCPQVRRGNSMDQCLAGGDFDVVVEVVRFAMLADIELVGNGLAVDCVEQRVQLSRNGVGRIEVSLCRFS